MNNNFKPFSNLVLCKPVDNFFINSLLLSDRKKVDEGGQIFLPVDEANESQGSLQLSEALYESLAAKAVVLQEYILEKIGKENLNNTLIRNLQMRDKIVRAETYSDIPSGWMHFTEKTQNWSKQERT